VDSDGDGSYDLQQAREHNEVNEIDDTDEDDDAITEGGGEDSWVDPVYGLGGNALDIPRPLVTAERTAAGENEAGLAESAG